MFWAYRHASMRYVPTELSRTRPFLSVPVVLPPCRNISVRARPTMNHTALYLRPCTVLLVALALTDAIAALPAQKSAPQQAVIQWKTVPFAIVRYNDEAPKSWNVYHSEKKGVYLVRLWKRYLLVDTTLESIFEIDPAKIKVEGDNAELSTSDIPADPIETTQWKSRDAGPVLRHRFRFGQDGNFVELQIPLLINGKPAY